MITMEKVTTGILASCENEIMMGDTVYSVVDRAEGEVVYDEGSCSFAIKEDYTGRVYPISADTHDSKLLDICTPVIC